MSSSSSQSFEALRGELLKYTESRREHLDRFLVEHLTLRECAQLQKRHFLVDLLRNPLNVLYAIPLLSLRKSLEVAEKLGFESAKSFGARIPSALRTDFQDEVERLIAAEFFELDSLTSLPGDYVAEIRKAIRDYCTRQGGVNDLATSGVTLFMAHLSFGDSSLDVFGIARRVAALWAKDKAASGFFLGKNIGQVIYDISPPTPSRSEVFFATAAMLALLALFSTVAGLVLFAVQNPLGFRRRQLLALLASIEDRLLLKLAKQ